MRQVLNTPTFKDAQEQVKYWKKRLHRAKGEDKKNCIVQLHRAYMVYQTKLINTKEAA